MEDQPEEYIPIVPRPDIKEHLILTDDNGDEETIELNLDNTSVILHKNGYERMDHIFVRLLGDYGIRMFKIHETPLGRYFVERGYDVVQRSYPNDATAAEHIDMELNDGLREWETGDGHELEDSDE